MTMYQHFTSLPPEQEATFIVYEQRSVETEKTGIKIGAIIGGVLGVVALVMALAVESRPNPHAAQPAASQTQKADN
jgi:hypothetical protein